MMNNCLCLLYCNFTVLNCPSILNVCDLKAKKRSKGRNKISLKYYFELNLY